jgi:hypothetical protein
MTAQSLYNELTRGKMSESKFLAEIRKDENLPMITKFNSFKDTIQILKTRGVITEEIGKYKIDKDIVEPELDIKTIDQVSPYEFAKGIQYEAELFDKSVGQNMVTDEELLKNQNKVLKNLTKDDYYYTRKMMSDVEKKQDKADLDYTELGKETNSKNQMVKGKVIKENLDQYYTQDEEECEDCERSDMDIDTMSPQDLEILGQIIEEWGLTEYDLNDEEVIEELADELTRRHGGIEEAIAVKDKSGNIQYAKDDNEATNMMNSAKTKGVQLTKTNV